MHQKKQQNSHRVWKNFVESHKAKCYFTFSKAISHLLLMKQIMKDSFRYFFEEKSIIFLFYWSFSSSPSAIPPSSPRWPRVPPSHPPTELEDPWTVVITLPEAITAERRRCRRARVAAEAPPSEEPADATVGWQREAEVSVAEISQTLVCLCGLQAVSAAQHENMKV